jgi:hypothetical protein
MANECSVFEMRSPRRGDMPIRTVPALAKQQLSTTGTSAAFNASTTMVSIHTTAGSVEFSRVVAGVMTDPDGTGVTWPLAINTYYDFDVQPGTKVRFV